MENLPTVNRRVPGGKNQHVARLAVALLITPAISLSALASIPADIEALLLAVGCLVVEGDGSRVRFIKDDVMAYFHRPHPKKEAAEYQVRDAKAFLKKLGVTP